MEYYNKMVYYTNPCGHKSIITDTLREFAEKYHVNYCKKCKK